MDSEEIKKVLEDPDYICIKRYGNSLERLKSRYPGEVPNHIAAAALGVDEEAFEDLYHALAKKMAALMGVDKD